jgi:EpsI family protein
MTAPEPIAAASATLPRRPLWASPVLVVSVALVIVAAAIGLQPVLQIVHFSWTERYGHFELGYLVLALGLWMAVRYWRAAPPDKLQPDWWSVLPLLGLIAVLGLFELMFINSGRAVLLPLLFIASVALVLGRPAAGRLFWPAMFIYFALPQWWAINGLLQSLTSFMVTSAVAWTGIPAFIEGNFVYVPAGVFEIASGCSGLNYLLSGLALGAFLALMYLRRWKHRLMVLAVSAVLAIVSNWVRVYVLVLVGHLSDMQHYLITGEHHTFGWVLFLVLMAPLVLVQRWLEGREAGAARAGGTAQVVVQDRAGPVIAGGILPAALVAATLLLSPRVLVPSPVDGPQPVAPLPATLGGLATNATDAGAWQPGFQNSASDRVSVPFHDARVEVYRAVYAQQDFDHRLVGGGNDFLGPGFRGISRQRQEVAGPGVQFTVMEHRGVLAEQERLVWSWYWAAGVPAATSLGAKLAELRGLAGGRRDGVAVALSTECRPDCDAARGRLQELLVNALGGLQWQPPADGQLTHQRDAE